MAPFPEDWESLSEVNSPFANQIGQSCFLSVVLALAVVLAMVSAVVLAIVSAIVSAANYKLFGHGFGCKLLGHSFGRKV
jgi:hypothetical protein